MAKNKIRIKIPVKNPREVEKVKVRLYTDAVASSSCKITIAALR